MSSDRPIRKAVEQQATKKKPHDPNLDQPKPEFLADDWYRLKVRDRGMRCTCGDGRIRSYGTKMFLSAKPDASWVDVVVSKCHNCGRTTRYRDPVPL